MPRSVLISLLTLVAVAGVTGGWIGWRWTPMNETEAINRVARDYVSQTGNAVSDCVAIPGDGAVWLRVICDKVEYRLDRRGRLLPEPQPST